MESFLIEWPVAEKWFISHSRLEAEGKIMVLEFLKEGETRENWQELASMITHIGAKMEEPALIWRNIIEESRQKFPEAKVNLMAESPLDEFPWGLYSMENHEQPTICLIVQGKQGIYMNAVVFRARHIDPATKEKWTQRFLSGKVLPQGIQQTLKQSNLAHLHLPNPPSSKTKPQPAIPQEAPKWLTETDISALFHPQKPGDLPVFIWEEERLQSVWVNMIDQKDGVYRGSVLPEQEHFKTYSAHEVLFFQYVSSVGKMIQVSPQYLAEIPDWQITPCQPCGFDMLVKPPSDYTGSDQWHFHTRCPNCGGKIAARHKQYIPPREEQPLTGETERSIPWWKFWLFWSKKTTKEQRRNKP